MRVTLQNPAFFEEVSQALKQGKEVSFRVNGWSMLPFYFHNETVVTVKDEPFEVGDVVLYQTHQIKLHRIVGMKDDVYVIEGDAQNESEVVEAKSILGKVVFYEHNKKRYYPNDPMLKKRVNRWLKVKKLPFTRLYLRTLRFFKTHR